MSSSSSFFFVAHPGFLQKFVARPIVPQKFVAHPGLPQKFVARPIFPQKFVAHLGFPQKFVARPIFPQKFVARPVKMIEITAFCQERDNKHFRNQVYCIICFISGNFPTGK